MSKLVIHSEALNDFVNTYFVEMDFSQLDSITDDYVISLLSHVEKAMVDINTQNYDDNDPNLWFNREICLRALVILTQLIFFAEILSKHSYMERAMILLGRVVESFNKKVMEDPEIVKAIAEDRLDEELEKHFPIERLSSKRNSNFIELVDENDLDAVPDEFQPIPEQF
jgi:hypothetical protein